MDSSFFTITTSNWRFSKMKTRFPWKGVYKWLMVNKQPVTTSQTLLWSLFLFQSRKYIEYKINFLFPLCVHLSIYIIYSTHEISSIFNLSPLTTPHNNYMYLTSLYRRDYSRVHFTPCSSSKSLILRSTDI